MAEPQLHIPDLPMPDINLPIHGPQFDRPDPDTIEKLKCVSSATASAMLHRMGVRQTFIEGPIARTPGSKIIGSAVTLQFMPQREDIVSGMAQHQEYAEREGALWRVFDTVQTGDVLVIQAFGDQFTGCVGEMLVTYFKGRGGIGLVVDGRIRDWPRVQEIGIPAWTRGFTPNYASQASLFPWGYNVPIAASRVLVLPGDIIIADDDGAVAVPIKLVHRVLAHALEHEDWEVFSRQKLAEGGQLMKYYPLNEEGRREYEQWAKENLAQT